MSVTTPPEMRDKLRILNVIFFTAVAVSVVHYTDNWLNFADYPLPESGPKPVESRVPFTWAVLTAIGIVGYLAYRTGRIRRGAALLAVYSFSGLVGFLHYVAVPLDGALAMPWWRHVHIIADIALGIAVLVFAISSVRRERAARFNPA